MFALTLAEVSEITGIGPQELRDWVKGGIITPKYPGGRGKGLTHRFSFMQTIGIRYLVSLNMKRLDLKMAKATIDYFGSLTEVELIVDIIQKRRYVWYFPPQGLIKLIKWPSDEMYSEPPTELDIGKAWRHVEKKMGLTPPPRPPLHLGIPDETMTCMILKSLGERGRAAYEKVRDEEADYGEMEYADY